MRQHEEQAARLEQLAGVYDSDAPARAQMLSHVYLHSTLFKEKRMSMFERLFAGRNWAARVAIAMVLMLLVAGAAVLLPRIKMTDSGPRPEYARTLAATNGVVLTYDLAGMDYEPIFEQLEGVKKTFSAGLPEGVTVKFIGRIENRKERVLHDGQADADAPETTEVSAQASFLITSDDEQLRTDLAAAAASAVPALPQPRLEDATWFSENGGMIEGGINLYLNFDGKGHQFVFPDGVSEEEVEATINAWLAENKPQFQHSVDVNIETCGDGEAKERKVEVRIESKGEGEGHKPAG